MLDTTVTNDGFYEVAALLAAPARLQLRGIGTIPTVETFTVNQLVAGAGVSGTVTKVNVSVMRAGTDGLWEQGRGAVTPVGFTDVPTGGGTVLATTATANLTMGYYGVAGGTEVVAPTSGQRTGQVWGWVSDAAMGWVASMALINAGIPLSSITGTEITSMIVEVPL